MMEMPKGYKELMSMTEAEDAWILQEDFTKERVLKALAIVKEMAEAIEQIMNEEAPCDESKDEGPVVDYVISINTIAGNVLKKFKEWK